MVSRLRISILKKWSVISFSYTVIFYVLILFSISSCSNKDRFNGDYSLEVVSRAEAVLKPESNLNQSSSLDNQFSEENHYKENEDFADSQKNQGIVNDENGIPLQLRVLPTDSQILINGEWVGRGIYSGKFTFGSSLFAEFKRDGFRDQSIKITVTEGVTDFRVELEPNPIAHRISVPPGKAVGDLLTPDWGILSYISEKGRLISIDIESGIVKDLELSQFSELLESPSSEISVGRRITSVGSKILLPEDGSLSLIDPKKIEKNFGYGKVWTYPLKMGSRMSAGVWGDKAIIVDQVGIVHLVSLSSGENRGLVKTHSFQPRGFAPVVFANRAIIVGRGGVISIVDLKELSLLKEFKIEGTMLDSPVAGSAGIYLFGNNTISGFSWFEDGFLYKIEQVAAPPLLFHGRLYYGTLDGRFFVADAATGRILKSTTLGLELECRPLALSRNRIAVKTEGEILILNTAGMVE